MTGASFVLATSDIATIILPRLKRLAYAQVADLKDVLGAAAVSQTTLRITSEKKSPDGVAWKENLKGTSILWDQDGLRDSIAYEVSRDEVFWGSNLEYALIHQQGGKIRRKNKKALNFKLGNKSVTVTEITMPARPYLGLSPDNIDKMTDDLNRWLEELLQ